jgi:hypothetical protein
LGEERENLSIDKINYKAKKRQNYSKEVFYQALRDSFNKMVVDGAELSKTAIIANAVFPDGSSVGETTIYGRRSKTKEYIHKDFLLELDGLIDSARISLRKSNEAAGNKSRKETATEAIVRLRADKKRLEMENSSILAQFLILEDGIAKSTIDVDRNTVKMLELELYVVSSMLNQRIGGCVAVIDEKVKNYEMKYDGQKSLVLANKKISAIEKEIRESTIVPMFGNMDEI